MTFISQDVRGQRLTPREIEVLVAVACGLTDAAIAKRILTSEATAKTHVRRAMVKLGAVNRANMVAAGFVEGYLRLNVKTLQRRPIHSGAA